MSEGANVAYLIDSSSWFASLDARNFSLMELLNGNIRHLTLLFIKAISIGHALCITTDGFDNNMILSRRTRIMAYLFVKNT